MSKMADPAEAEKQSRLLTAREVVKLLAEMINLIHSLFR